MGGGWHGGVQQWVSLDEGQDIIREISGRGEQGSYTYSCTGSWPGGHRGRGCLRAESWGCVRLCASPPNMISSPCCPPHTHATAFLPRCSPPVPPPTQSSPLPRPGHLPLSLQSHLGSRHCLLLPHTSHPHPGYLGEGTLSSDTGVQAPSVLFCSLNLPSNPRSISSR